MTDNGQREPCTGDHKCPHCGKEGHAGFVDYNLSPVLMIEVLKRQGTFFDPRSFEDPEKLRKFVGLPETPAENYDFKEMVEKLNSIKNYNIGNVSLVTQPKAFTESVCCYIVEERLGYGLNERSRGKGYICFTKQAQEYAQWKGDLFLHHRMPMEDVQKVCSAFQQVFGDRFHWCGPEETIRIKLLEKPGEIVKT